MYKLSPLIDKKLIKKVLKKADGRRARIMVADKNEQTSTLAKDNCSKDAECLEAHSSSTG
jgi:hypothetical protein